MAELKLDNLVRVLNDRKTTSRGREVFAEEIAKEYARAKATAGIIDRLGQPHVTPDEFNAGLDKVSKGLLGLAKKIEESKTDLAPVISSVQSDIAPILDAFKALEAGVGRMVNAVMSIQIPSVEIPPFPEPQRVDLSPVLDALDGIYRVLAEMQAEEAEDEAEEKPKEWVFEVKRNQAGFIRTVEARQV